MLRRLHHILSQNPLASRAQRSVVHWAKELLSVPDAYYSMGQLYRKIKPKAVLDIGSHVGRTVIKILDYMPDAKVHAFEPTPRSVAILRNRMRRYPNVMVHELALSDVTGTTKFFHNLGEQTNSLLENSLSGKSPFDGVQQHIAQIDVRTMTLDDWAAEFEPNGMLLIKADVQGAERLLVTGGKKTFAQRVAAFYTELCLLPTYENQTTLWELHTMLTEEFGLALFDIYPCAKDQLGRAAFTDAMWVQPSVLPI